MEQNTATAEILKAISTSTTYTHLVDINKDGDTAVINGVAFDNTLANYTLTGATNPLPGNVNNGADPGSGMRTLSEVQYQ